MERPGSIGTRRPENTSWARAVAVTKGGRETLYGDEVDWLELLGVEKEGEGRAGLPVCRTQRTLVIPRRVDSPVPALAPRALGHTDSPGKTRGCCHCGGGSTADGEGPRWATEAIMQ